MPIHLFINQKIDLWPIDGGWGGFDLEVSQKLEAKANNDSASMFSVHTCPQWSSSSGIFQYRMNETREDITCPGLEGGREVTVNSTHAAAKWLLWWGGAMDWPCTRSDP